MNGKTKKNLISLLLAILDIFFINLGYLLIFHLWKGKFTTENIEAYITVIPVISITALILFNIYGIYNIERRNISELAVSSVIALFFSNVIGMASSFFLRSFAFPRSVFIGGFILQTVFIVTLRYIAINLYKKIHGPERLLIVGREEDAKQIINSISRIDHGWVDCRYAVLENEAKMLEWAMNLADTIFLTAEAAKNLKKEIVDASLKGKKIAIIPDLYEILMPKARLVTFDDLLVFEFPHWNVSRGQRVIKRVLDFISAFVGLILSLPLIIIISILIKLTSEGPILYIQERIGQYGKKFKLYKFRTMINNAEKHTGPVMAGKDDPRLTPLGKILRALRFDEIPQLINVLKGDMSLIGPRPERPVFVEKYCQINPYYNYRHLVKPGITGLAQVMGSYDTSFEDKLRYDLYYISNYSLLLDLKIFFLTLKTILLAEGIVKKKNIDVDEQWQNMIVLCSDELSSSKENK
ncbi:sugar transferase [Thermosediminibacter oceani]|uniref:Exopolysaccharide biosynthesis polyprenyl glycosylphosphotransferase n=1 Tax=Thermosediminibacter oceani (strain ATCC BAA-1034 / DSM 16646 / JW/IW-1228P) TaxID=555079 RepID=D9S1J3_THEOJ|nr:sugar transferase [Thermosediminibacter oceani]ADL07270.1 exopolysaccharide biosynthesis polyprenyl glycosylphosphotransferase [Thermosediminibacter oceani DSM 16646]